MSALDPMLSARTAPATQPLRTGGRGRTALIAALAWAAAAGVLALGAVSLCAPTACTVPAVDARVLQGMHALQTPALTAFFAPITWLGSIMVLLPAALALCAWQLRPGRNSGAPLSPLAYLPPLALAGAWLLAHLGKFVIARPRPDLHEALIRLPQDASFPSAHTLQITAFALAALSALGAHRRWLPALLALLTVAAVTLSRLYLQVHFPSDVLFGLLAAAVWTGGLYYALARAR